ncbi:hypothetical protein DPMN_003536 [Dreissena polymorpha]|uniref:Uncharacterized protein n=1 Tax=Dreissena polymorpha TaxID=45954 RepID=A0A9D4RUU1_DREPO|nr:hypothetical protein DPMN_003536 [Dreissena polymorpha]
MHGTVISITKINELSLSSFSFAWAVVDGKVGGDVENSWKTRKVKGTLAFLFRSDDSVA